MSPSAITTALEGDDDRDVDGLSGGSNGADQRNHLSNGHTNGHTNGLTSISSQSSSLDEQLLDLLCVGFGPASLAIAIALHDANKSPAPKALFLEKQTQFAWHAGMQLPGAHMQISFLKDLATPRDPRSKFTFLNYLFDHGRLNQFINLDTFLPSRLEYEDYLRWCAGHFEREGKVRYGMAVEGVRVASKSVDGKVTSWSVAARDQSGNLITRRARHVVIAVGGQPVIPANMQGLENVAHSSKFATTISHIQKKEVGRPLRFAVIGSGQSAAEIFNDLWTRFPDASVKLIIKGSSLRPSDDSPFVNEIFDPDRVDGIYAQPADERAAALALDRGTNYGVVRLSLLEHLYERLYKQRITTPDASRWSARIVTNRVVVSACQSADSSVILKLADSNERRRGDAEPAEDLEVDYVFTATGYRRDAHVGMLADVQGLSADGQSWDVGRDYRVKFGKGKVDENAGLWLQGCNEKTHGLSDTLLSILAVRSGNLVESMFGKGEEACA